MLMRHVARRKSGPVVPVPEENAANLGIDLIQPHFLNHLIQAMSATSALPKLNVHEDAMCILL